MVNETLARRHTNLLNMRIKPKKNPRLIEVILNECLAILFNDGSILYIENDSGFKVRESFSDIEKSDARFGKNPLKDFDDISKTDLGKQISAECTNIKSIYKSIL